MTKLFIVELHATTKSFYEVEANSEDHAAEIWPQGAFVYSESTGLEPYRVDEAEMADGWPGDPEPVLAFVDGPEDAA